MDENYLSELIALRNNSNLTRYALVFVGGMIAGYAIKKTIDSADFENIKTNASKMLDDYFNHEVEYVDDEEESEEVVRVVEIE